MFARAIALAEAIQPLIPVTTQLVAVTSHVSGQDQEYFLQHSMMLLAKPITEETVKTFFQNYLRVVEVRGIK